MINKKIQQWLGGMILCTALLCSKDIQAQEAADSTHLYMID